MNEYEKLFEEIAELQKEVKMEQGEV